MPEKTSRTLRVFLCHASEDKQKARELYQKLTDDGIDAWLDEKKLLPGQDWKAEIDDALRAADAILVCLSRKSISKEGFVQREIKHAIDIAEEKPEGTIFLIPVRWDDCAVPRRIADKQYVDLFDPDGYQKLLLALSVRAKSLGLSLAGRKPEPVPDKRFELLAMIKNMVRDDDGLQETLLHLADREPDKDGWFHTEIRRELQEMMGDQNHPVKERARAGDALAQMGDPRFRPDAWYLPNDDSLGFVEIPAGSFLMGNDSPANNPERHRESPQHPVDLPTFHINRHPVTVAQYRLFLMETNPNEGLREGDPSLDNHPVLSVTWHQAIKYCQWLTEKLRNWSETPEDIAQRLRDSSWVVTLPSEAEWEKAARGTADSRNYPWGPTADPNRANYAATSLGHPSATGCFESGRSPYGIYDMSGNVWEWTRSNWGTSIEKPHYIYPYDRQDNRDDIHASDSMLKVIRGGSCYSPQEDIRCHHRGADLPGARREHIGFRLVISFLEQPGVKSRNTH